MLPGNPCRKLVSVEGSLMVIRWRVDPTHRQPASQQLRQDLPDCRDAARKSLPQHLYFSVEGSLLVIRWRLTPLIVNLHHVSFGETIQIVLMLPGNPGDGSISEEKPGRRGKMVRSRAMWSVMIWAPPRKLFAHRHKATSGSSSLLSTSLLL